MELLGDSIADVKFNPDDLFLGGEDQDLDLEVSVLNLQKFSIALHVDLGMRRAVEESSLREAVMREQSFRLERYLVHERFSSCETDFPNPANVLSKFVGNVTQRNLKINWEV